MPIDIDRFENARDEELRAGGPTNAEKILAFLAANPDQAYAPKEIRNATDIPKGSVGVVLGRLEDRGLVRHKGDYWAIVEDTESAPTLTAMQTARAMTDRFGSEDPEEWGPGVDPDHSEDA